MRCGMSVGQWFGMAERLRGSFAMASRVVSGLMVAAIVAVGASTSQAQQKELSDHSVAVLMDYAWTILPALFRGPNGKVIEVDKKTKTREELTVPVDVGREVIKVGYVSAQAQLCDMLEERGETLDYCIVGEPSSTAELADVVLPVASAFEREALKTGFHVSPAAQSHIQLRQAVVAPRGEARSE